MKTFAQIQKELVAPKGQFNKFGKYYYRSCEDILSGLKEVLGDWSLVINDEIVLVGERYYVKATATCLREYYIEQDLKKESYSATAYAREALNQPGMAEAQLTGSTSSYARKYALNALFCIDDTQDADTQDNSKKEPVKKPEPLDNKKRLDLIDKISNMIGDRVQGMDAQEKGKFLFSLGGIKSSNDLKIKKLSELETILLKLDIPWE